jgi:hypothetical protein
MIIFGSIVVPASYPETDAGITDRRWRLSGCGEKLSMHHLTSDKNHD